MAHQVRGLGLDRGSPILQAVEYFCPLYSSHRADYRAHGCPSYTTRMCTAIRRFEDHMAGVHCSVSCVCGPVPNHVLGPRGIFRGVGSWRRGRGAYLLLLSITQSGLHARLGRHIPAIHWGTARDLCLHTPLWVARLLGLHVPTRSCRWKRSSSWQLTYRR